MTDTSQRPEDIAPDESCYDTDYETGQDNVRIAGLDLHNPVFFISAVIILGFAGGTLAYPESAKVLLEGANWRPHIVGACAVMAGVRGPRLVDRLWDRIDGASWVSPQLSVAAEAADPGYPDKVHRRLEAVLAGCWLQRDGLSPLDCPERPFGSAGVRAKALAALCALVDDELAADPAVVSFLAGATDGGDRLARGWRAAVDKAGSP